MYKRIMDVAIGLVLGIFVSYASDYIYLKMRQDGLTPRLPFFKADASGNSQATDIFLLPFNGFPEPSARLLADALEKDTGLNVTSTGAIPLPEEFLNRERNQYDVRGLASVVEQSVAKLRTPNHKQIFIAVMKQDMYSGDSSWNFSLASSFDGGINIVATERLVPYEPGNLAMLDLGRAEAIYGERVYKMLKRTVGLQFYGHGRSSDRKSLLFSPIMSVTDVDDMGLSY